MLKFHNSRFKKLIKNLTRGCLVQGHIVDASGELTSTEEVNQLLRVSHKAITNAGDHVTYMGYHYALSSYSKEPYDIIYRLIPLPDQVEWQVQKVFITDPLTGLKKPVDTVSPPAQILWCKKKTDGFGMSVAKKQDENVCYLMTEVVQVGDLLDGKVIKTVVKEQDIYKAEV